MFFKEISLLNFRNYKRAALRFQPGISLVFGANGEGKSNFLEALYCLCFARSYRAVRDEEMVNWDSAYYYLQGTVYSKNCCYRLEVGYEPAGRRKVVKINGRIEKKGEYLRSFPVVFFVPEDLEIVRRGPEERRRFLDRELCQYSAAYAADLHAYRRALLQKNRLLKDKAPFPVLKELLEPWNRQIIQYGSRIICQRVAAVHTWNKLASANYQLLFRGPDRLSLSYLSSALPPGFEGNNATELREVREISELMARAIKLREGEERARGHCLVGPHKDDLLFLLDRREAKKFASHGQQRSAVIALKAAQAQHYRETVERPIFMIDDIFSELDEDRRRQCLLLFHDAAQVFMTATAREEAGGSCRREEGVVSFFYVSKGKIREAVG